MFSKHPKPQFELLEAPERGIVDEEIGPNQPGRVKAMGSHWPAEIFQPESQTPLLAGDRVLVLAIRNITLLVVKQ